MQLLDDILDDLTNWFGLFPESETQESRQSQRRVDSLAVKQAGEKVVFFTPASFSQVQAIVEKLKAGNAVIVKLEELSTAEATRTIDFISGAMYALEGSTEKLGENIFLFTPPGVEISYG